MASSRPLSLACLIIPLQRLMSRAISFSHRTCSPASMHVLAMMSCVFSGVAMMTASRPSFDLSDESLSRVSYFWILSAVLVAVDLVEPLARPGVALEDAVMFDGRMSQTATISLNSGLCSPTRTPPSSPQPMSAVRTALFPFHDW